VGCTYVRQFLGTDSEQHVPTYEKLLKLCTTEIFCVGTHITVNSTPGRQAPSLLHYSYCVANIVTNNVILALVVCKNLHSFCSVGYPSFKVGEAHNPKKKFRGNFSPENGPLHLLIAANAKFCRLTSLVTAIYSLVCMSVS